MAEGFDSDQYLLKLRWDLRDRLLQELKPDLNNNRQRFIPRDALFDIINHKSVLKILEASSSPTDDNAIYQEIAQRLCPESGNCLCNRCSCTGWRVLFSILILVGRENVFLGPALHPVCDRIWFAQRNLQGNSTALGLTEAEARLFDYWQWQVFTPFIESLSANVQEFHDEVSLPWSELTSARDRIESLDDDIEGQVTVVQKVRIYTRNHNLPNIENGDDYFAVKFFTDVSILEARKEMFKREVQANRNTPQHIRIVPLLAAFEHCQIPYLLFPWAQGGNLQELWKTYNPTEATWYSDNWLFNECYQVTDALATTQGLSDSGSVHQLHLDVKPENILCFESFDGGKQHFILKLSDFGEARQFRPGESIDLRFIPHVKTQRPPENEATSSKYDVWCLGCVFLEFVTWALRGWPGWKCFRDERLKEQDAPESTDSRFEDDIFFKKAKGKRKLFPIVDCKTTREFAPNRTSTRHSFQIVSHVEIVFQLKDCVITHLRQLKEQQGCSSKLQAFVEFIQERMLVVDVETRADASEVTTFFRGL